MLCEKLIMILCFVPSLVPYNISVKKVAQLWIYYGLAAPQTAHAHLWLLNLVTCSV